MLEQERYSFRGIEATPEASARKPSVSFVTVLGSVSCDEIDFKQSANFTFTDAGL
jgi:hypothetical protein